MNQNNNSDVDGIAADIFQGGPTEATGVNGRRPVDTYQWQISTELRYATEIDFGINFINTLDWNAGPPRRFGVEVAFKY